MIVDKDKVASNIIDNSSGRELIRVIKDQLKRSKEAKFAIGYFFLSGFSLVKSDFPDNFSKLPFLKIVMGNETTYPTKEELVAGYSLRELFKQRMIEDLQRQELTEKQKSQLRTLRDFIANNVIDVKLFERTRLHAKLYMFITKPEEKYGSPGLAVVGSSNFTAEGLTKNKELNVLITSREEVLYLNQWFDKLWDEAINFREDLLKVIDISGVLPESPYPKIGKLIDSETLFKYFVYKWFEGRVLNLLKKDILMEFQLVGVINAVDKVSFYNGVILADSVGLGKSFMASAVIEEFVNGKHPSWVPNGKDPCVMLILPPSVIPQWEELLTKSNHFFKENIKKLIYDSNNCKVYEIYDSNEKFLGKIKFLSLGIFQNLEEAELNKIKEEYTLFVIDEAHKYRNKNTHRWKKVRSLRTKEGNFPNKFLLLTATPLNNSINDIFNLISLFMDETFAPFKVKGVNITELIGKYNKLKRDLVRKDDEKLKEELKRTAVEIKKKVLDEVMVLRTRKYITEQFKDIKVNGNPLIFRDPKPYSLDYSSFYTKSYQHMLEVVNNNISKVLFEYTKLYGTRFIVFEDEAMEGEKPVRRLIEIADLFKLLLGKRLESGIYSFEVTLRRIYKKEEIFYKFFKTKMGAISKEEDLRDLIREVINKAGIEKELEEVQERYNIEEEDKETWFDRVVKILLEYAEGLRSGEDRYSRVELIKLGLSKILENIGNDLKLMDAIFYELDKLKEKNNGEYKTLGKLPKKGEDIDNFYIYSYRDDPKLSSLKQIIGNPAFKSQRLKEIPSLNRKRILIFTQYRDTAYYLYHNFLDWVERETALHSWLKTKHGGMKIALVTGDTDPQAKISYIKRFAPEANNGFTEVDMKEEIEILISTDALSEGVNLQGADVVINYDLPWNPMIIVQRVGRVNRIGNNKEVCVINYIPSNEIEVIVGVLSKLREKIRDITLIVGKDVKILSPEEEISIETFGERIKNISELSMTDLEEYGVSEDFKKFMPEGIPQEQLDEYKLLNIIQYDLGYTIKDFGDVIEMRDGPYYSFVDGKDKIVSVYEFYRGKYKIMKKVVSISKGGEICYETPFVFLDLVRKRERTPRKIESAVESLKRMKDEVDAIVEELKKGYQQEQRGFLAELRKALLRERSKLKANEVASFWQCVNVVQLLPYRIHSKPLKEYLVNFGLIDIGKKSEVKIRNLSDTINKMIEYFTIENITGVESLDLSVKHLGWYYEV